eukprot:1146041-Pelagomonas_calceolata.AAC.23
MPTGSPPYSAPGAAQGRCSRAAAWACYTILRAPRACVAAGSAALRRLHQGTSPQRLELSELQTICSCVWLRRQGQKRHKATLW